MSQPAPEQPIALPPSEWAGNTVSFRFDAASPLEWIGRAFCKHGLASNRTYMVAPGAPPLNHSLMVESVFRQHDLIVGCNCPREAPELNATITFQVPVTGVQPGQQRYVPQQSATIQPPARNLWWGPGLTCARTGAYSVQAKVQLSRGLAEGARGLGVILVSGAPLVNVLMADEGGKATANISVMLNLNPNQSIAVGFENTSSAAQDVQLATLQIFEVWVPNTLESA